MVKRLGQILWHAAHFLALVLWTYVAVMASWNLYPRFLLIEAVLMFVSHLLILYFSEGVFR